MGCPKLCLCTACVQRWTDGQRAPGTDPEPLTLARLPAAPGYEPLAAILDEALGQAQSGKGHERHGSGHGSFDDQRIIQLNEQLGDNHGALYQACKKIQESSGLPPDRARLDLLGAINYVAAAIRVLDRRPK